VALTQKAELKRQIDELLASGHIERAQSPYGAGVLFVEKHDKSLRLCVDYRRLNAITVKDVYPMPRVDVSIDKMKDARFFAKMDLRSGFYQIRVNQEDVHKTAFQTEWGSFQWLVMPFGLTNAPSTFQRTMDMAFDRLKAFTAVYMDDIVIFSKSWTEHLANIKTVLEKLREWKLYVKKSKCDFASEEIDFVGFRVSEKGIRTQPEKIEALEKWPIPQNVANIRSFTGFTNFYQKFVPNYAHIVAPLSALLRKDTEWTWGETQQKAFDTVI